MPAVAAETAALAERTLGHLDPARVAADPAAGTPRATASAHAPGSPAR